MLQSKFIGMKGEAMEAVPTSKSSVVPSVAVVHVTDDRAGHVLEMEPELVATPRARSSLDQGVATIVKAAAKRRLG